MNVRDSESADALLQGVGLLPAPDESTASLVLVNTCSVRGKAEDKALGKLGLLVARKREQPELKVGVMGCMVQRLGESLLESVPGIDFALGTRRLFRLPEIVELVFAGRGPIVDTGEDGADFEGLSGHVQDGPAAFVNILFGCNRRCAYCIVPDVRGREVSREPGRIVSEIRGLTGAGVREVTLLGQSVMNYGRVGPRVWPEGYVSALGLEEPFPRLLEAVSQVAELKRVRFTSSHPSGCTSELALCMSRLKPVCEHLHLPLQSGADRILRLMRRGYDAEGYRDAVSRLREAVPCLSLTTDVIVGFPTESEAEFEATRAMMDEIGFDNAYIFKYSPRAGTPAAGMPDDVPEGEKRRRNQVLLDDQDRRGLRLNDALVGQTVEVLAEGASLRNAARWSGRTRSNKIVVFDPVPGVVAGCLVNVSIERARAQTLYGKVCEREREGAGA
jgi:tRNA-2-methylthio-N6-dimethylallyladenosine synthase